MLTPARREQRRTIRFNKVFEVLISSAQHGEVAAIARNISTGGMLIETSSPLPLGSTIQVRFEMPDSDASILAIAEVKHHYALNYTDRGAMKTARGMGVKFLEFISDDPLEIPAPRTRMRTLH